MFHDRVLTVHIDNRDIRGGEKNWEWIKKGVPVRIEVGPRDIEAGNCVILRRDQSHQQKTTHALHGLGTHPKMCLKRFRRSILMISKSSKSSTSAQIFILWIAEKVLHSKK